MRNSLWSKAAIAVLLLAVGFTLVSGQVNQTSAYTPHHGGHYHGHYYGHYYGGYYSYWYYPYYSYSYYCPYYYGTYCSYYYGNYSSYYYGNYGNYYSYLSPYQLTVNSNPSGVSSQPTGGGSYNYGSTASFSTQNVIQVTSDTRYVFTHWSGDYSGASPTASITMTSSKTVTAVYQMQYLLTVTAQPSNAPSPQGGWYNAGDTVSLTVPSQTVGGSDGTRLAFNGWSVDGNNQAGNATNLQMNAPHTVVAEYRQQYYLTVNADQGVPSGEGWYDAGTTAPISVSTPASPSFGVNIVFNGWQGDVQSPSQSTQVMMDGAKTVTATWRTDSTLLYATIAVVLVAILLVAGVGFYSMTQRKRQTSPQPATSAPQPSKKRRTSNQPPNDPNQTTSQT